MLQPFRKNICLFKEFFLVNSFIGAFWRMLRQVYQQLSYKTLLTFGIFSIMLSICCCHLVVYYLTKPVWNCVNASQICCPSCYSLSLSLSVWLNMQRILIWRFHMTIFVGTLWKSCLVFWSYILEPTEVQNILQNSEENILC